MMASAAGRACRWLWALGLVAAAPAAGCGGDGAARPGRAVVTFADDVAPILRRHCAVCHRPGGPGPFPVGRYGEVRPYGPAIAAAVRGGIMPPWLPGPGDVPLAGERRLAPAEIEAIERWVAQGMPPGDTTALPAPAPSPADSGWLLGQPDLVLELPEPYFPPRTGRDAFRNFVFRSPVDSVRYVRAVEFRMTPPGAVHHAMLMVDPTAESRRLDAADRGPGYEGGMLTHTGAHSPEGHFVGWTPGVVPTFGPEGLAWRLDPGSDLVLQLHLRPRNADTAGVRPLIGLHLADGPPARVSAVIRLGSETIDIPAGAPEYVVTDSFRLPVDVEAISMYPHAHYLARSMLVTAEPPGRRALTLLWIPRWEFDWQDEYRFERPLPLPRGTILRIRYTYDNSAGNPRNPHQPPRRVRFGPQASDEMAELWMQVVVSDGAPRRELRPEVARNDVRIRREGLEHALRVAPDSAEAHVDVGNLYLRARDTRRAIPHYLEAIRLRPDLALAHYNLGVALQAEGQLASAVAHYRSAVESDPTLADGHLNLGIALLALGHAEEAVEALARAASLLPERAEAQRSLGVALVRVGRVAAGLEHLREALRLRPSWAPAALELAWTLATHPDAPAGGAAEAVVLAENEAMASAYRDPGSLYVLAAALGAHGEFERAIAVARDAARLAPGDPVLQSKLGEMLEAFRARRPYRERP